MKKIAAAKKKENEELAKFQTMKRKFERISTKGQAATIGHGVIVCFIRSSR